MFSNTGAGGMVNVVATFYVLFQFSFLDYLLAREELAVHAVPRAPPQLVDGVRRGRVVARARFP